MFSISGRRSKTSRLQSPAPKCFCLFSRVLVEVRRDDPTEVTDGLGISHQHRSRLALVVFPVTRSGVIWRGLPVVSRQTRRAPWGLERRQSYRNRRRDPLSRDTHGVTDLPEAGDTFTAYTLTSGIGTSRGIFQANERFMDVASVKHEETVKECLTSRRGSMSHRRSLSN